jgi:hypothetical protein
MKRSGLSLSMVYGGLLSVVWSVEDPVEQHQVIS